MVNSLSQTQFTHFLVTMFEVYQPGIMKTGLANILEFLSTLLACLLSFLLDMSVFFCSFCG